MNNTNFYSKKDYFLGSIKPLVLILVLLSVLVLIYALSSFLYYKSISPYFDELEMLFRAKGTVLMIIVSLPFFVIFFLSANYVLKEFFSKKVVNFRFSEDNLIFSIRGKLIEIKKNEITKSVFFIRKSDDLTVWLIIYQCSKANYVLSYRENNADFQNFINTYQDYFKILDKDVDIFQSSKKSALYKKTFYHESVCE